MSENVDELVCRLEATMTDIKSVMETCQAPSISLGVLHHGRVVFRRSIGLRDVEAGLKADSDTSYLLGSCSKLFTSTALGMLVEDKVSWDDPISKHLPEFNPIQDPSIRTEATIVDIARHSSGLANPNAVFLGPGGFTTVKGDDHIAMVNNLPTSNSSGQRFNSWWYYSNAAFGLVAEIIPRVSGVSFATFLREQLCKPLGLSQTLVTEADLKENKNVAHPYVRRDGGDWTRIHNECTSEAHGAVLASLGIRTSVNDMLAFCAGVMNRYDEEEGKVPVQDLLPQSASNPLRNISSMWNWWWGRPCEDGFENDSAYTLGWFRTTMPTSALGTLSYNTVRRIEDIIGKESAPRTVYGHNGCVNGSVATAYVIPESHSAVVVFANAADAGDAAETSSQILLQALFDLKPKVDLMPSLNASVAERRQMHDDMIKEWEAHRDAARFSCPPEELQGTYVGLGVSRIHIVPAEESPSGLAVVFGTQQASRCDLEPYNVDALSFLPLKHDDKLARAMIDWDYWTVGVLAFVRDVVKDEGDVAHHDGAVSGLRWQWDEYDYPGLWVKIKDGMSDEDIEAVFEKHGRFQDIPEFQQRFSAEARLDKDRAGAKEGAGVSSSL